jgi:signal transduction histidine kinase
LNYQRNEIIGKWQQQIWVVTSGFYVLAFAIGTIQIVLFPATHQLAVPPLTLVIGLGTYTVVRVLYSFFWHESDVSGRAIFGVDIAICTVLMISTGGIYSPFLIYSLVPVATAGLLLHGGATLGMACLTIIYIVAGHVWNPLLVTQWSALELERLLSFLVILSLVTALPYLINVSLRQQLESKVTLRERQRLSHTIHDGAAQMMSALCWQAQFVQRRLKDMNIDLDEVKQLTRLSEKVHGDIRECLESLRHGTDKARLSACLEDSAPKPGLDINADFRLSSKIAEFHPEAIVDAQLLYICREALTNIRKHSGAHEIQIKIKSVDKRLKMTITDDGRGFDALASNHDGVWTDSLGLEVMRERAESIGGQLKVISIPGQGTEIQVEVPISNKGLGSLL